jgi:hypothetical protein
MPQVHKGIKAPIILAFNTVINKFLPEEILAKKSSGTNLSIKDEANIAIKNTGRISAKR